MSIRFSHDGVFDVVGGGYDGLFSGWALCSVLYSTSFVIGFGERRVVYLEDLLIRQSWERFFDLENAGRGVGDLGVGHGGGRGAFTFCRACFLPFF